MKKFGLLFLCFILLLSFDIAWGSRIMLNSQSAKPGESVTFTVSLSQDPNANSIEAFGIEISFDSSALQYKGYSPGKLASSFDFFDANPVGNKIKIGGFGLTPVKVSNPTSLIHLDFTCIDCAQDTYTIEVARKEDDIKKWESNSGLFICKGTAKNKGEDEKQPASTEESGGKKITNLTNKDQTPENTKQGNASLSSGLYRHKQQDAQTSPSQGGAGGGGGDAYQESFDISAFSKAYGEIPSVTGSVPGDTADDVPSDSTIQILFNQSMDHVAVENAFTIDPHVEGRFEWKNSLTDMQFIPYTPLIPGTLYMVHITEQAKDIYGRPLDGDLNGKSGGEFCFRFRTGENRALLGEERPIDIAPKSKRCFISILGMDDADKNCL